MQRPARACQLSYFPLGSRRGVRRSLQVGCCTNSRTKAEDRWQPSTLGVFLTGALLDSGTSSRGGAPVQQNVPVSGGGPGSVPFDRVDGLRQYEFVSTVMLCPDVLGRPLTFSLKDQGGICTSHSPSRSPRENRGRPRRTLPSYEAEDHAVPAPHHPRLPLRLPPHTPPRRLAGTAAGRYFRPGARRHDVGGRQAQDQGRTLGGPLKPRS